jgi:dTDP-4-dehydrorhamnose 3,5-epimerase
MFDDIILYKSNILFDERGSFFELYNSKLQKKIKKKFTQDNISFSKHKFTFRGIHLQKKPYAQGKLITVLIGKIIDIVININKKSKYYLKYKKFYLDAKKINQIYVPEKYAHGFLTLTDNTLVGYKVTKKYKKSSEAGINIFDKKLNIKFKVNKNKIIRSQKDKNFKFL